MSQEIKNNTNLNNITNFIQKNKSKEGITIHEHLYRIIHKYLKNPNKLTNINNLELISQFLKKNCLNYTNPLTDKEVNNIPLAIAEHQEWIEQIKQLFKDIKKQQKNKQKLLFPNFYEQSQILQTASISFQEEESFQIHHSIRRLADQINASQMRFWGKFLTRGNDYYVAQCFYNNLNSDKMQNKDEQYGAGVNKYSYWVTQNVLDEWIELPLITAEQMQIAKQIKYICKGDLNANVQTYPHFNGKEKHFLKAQIVRITHGCELCPKGLYKLQDENDKEIEFEEEAFKLQDYQELLTLENWVHLNPIILKQGRVSLYVDPSLPEDIKEEKLEQLKNDDADTQVERLRDISQEKSPFAKGEEEEGDPNWIKREFGDLQQFNSQDEGTQLNYSVICFKNLTWPGAYLVSNSQQYCNIYIGYGLKQNQSPFLPVGPDDMQQEQDDTEEYPEPNPNVPPDVVETDSDEEKKEDTEDQ
ncbi:radial spoke head protein, putative [Ichthyophthirius multifiliis]|uniref:Radial spoke head protein, putative n=1 Tax=Ichthyophthirius multifiliis TaxID=5932 RepID=G0QLS9_ICHMU|nr:radial spoke head protein, putative [Ichthyophthirius multifiliis]EGR33830.1 radial spoke head protein, putative [Ichthyophthirius multifiliis]|eukprot:XP_004039054.1 radial spoke head protein, putative [Ichthyophthirius multifiliis]